jgi:ureidoacrylate peracid hydrolase
VNVIIEAKPSPLEIDIERSTVLIIDVQNCTASDGGMWNLAGLDVSKFQNILGPITRLTESFRSKDRKVVYIVHCYSSDFRELGEPDSVLWARSPAYISYHEHPEWREKSLMRGTWGSEIVDEIKPKEDDIVIEKSRYSGFWGTNLDAILRSLNTRYLLIGGQLAHICVEATLRDAFYYGYFPIYVSDAVAAMSTETEQATINTVTSAYGWVTTSEKILKAM